MELSGTSYVILGMVRLGRRTGYDIKGLVDVSTRFFWAASYGQIYPELRRLEEAGLVRGRHEPHGGRRRRVYEITRAGERALHDWLTSDAEPLVFELRDEALLKFFFADALEPDEAVALVRATRRRHGAALDRLREIEPGARRASFEFPYLALQQGIGHHEWMIGWCESMERRLGRRARKAV